MANLGNAWHLPLQPEPAVRATMRVPVDPLVSGTAISITTGNQFAGDGGNPGNQLQDGSALFFRRQADADWTTLPMVFLSTAGNNKYYQATIAANTFAAGDVVDYYLRIPYSDHDTTFVTAGGGAGSSTTTADEPGARTTPFTFTVESSATHGEWRPVFGLSNVAIHAHVLPNGEVLMWGRRDDPNPNASLDAHECTPFVWNPAAGTDAGAFINTAQPARVDGTKVNLFCSGHTFLPDGKLLVVGGHLFDSVGIDQASVYDSQAKTWTPLAVMNDGRWYPSAVTLANGGALVLSGNAMVAGAGPDNPAPINPNPQIWQNGAWAPVNALPQGSFELFPRVHVASDGSVVMTGPQQTTWSLENGNWRPIAGNGRANGRRDYASSVMYDVDKIIYIGGGNDLGSQQPTANAEVLDLTAAAPQWRPTAKPMNFRRRQHNATILPDGTVLVTGGSQGGGGPGPGFNDLGPGEPVHVAELWDPVGETWTVLAAELVDRCYHSTAVLLPDGRVLSAGGGEYRPNQDGLPNPPEATHRDAQIFSPPYLFKGAQPQCTAAPASVKYGEAFEVSTPTPGDIAHVSWIRLSSTTHSFNMNQRINFLAFAVDGAGLKVTAPASANVCPPGHYMLFLLNRAGVPSVAKIVQVAGAAGAAAAPAARAAALGAGPEAAPDAFARRDAVLRDAHGTEVLVGVVSTCPYGISACWGGAHEALLRLDGVQAVDPIPDANRSTATVFLEGDGLPALDRWGDQFRDVVGATYNFRGVEVSLTGTLEQRDSQLALAAVDPRPAVALEPLAPGDKVQWAAPADAPEAVLPDEASAYERLRALAGEGSTVTVTGPLRLEGASYRLEVRRFDTA